MDHAILHGKPFSNPLLIGFLIFTNSLLSGKTFSSVVQTIKLGLALESKELHYLYGRARCRLKDVRYLAKRDKNIPNPLTGINGFRSFRSFDSFKHCTARNDKTKDGKPASIAVMLINSEMQTKINLIFSLTGLIRLLITGL